MTANPGQQHDTPFNDTPKFPRLPFDNVNDDLVLNMPNGFDCLKEKLTDDLKVNECGKKR